MLFSYKQPHYVLILMPILAMCYFFVAGLLQRYLLSVSHRVDNHQTFLCSGVTTTYPLVEMDQEAITERDITDPELMELIKQVVQYNVGKMLSESSLHVSLVYVVPMLINSKPFLILRCLHGVGD